jgi:hypothetical protein
MRTPWYCPYCKLASNRRSNISAHIERKHPGRYNPMPGMKQKPPFASYSSQPQNQSSNSNITRGDSFDPLQILEKSIKFQNILQEIKQLNNMEINFLLLAINNLLNFRNQSNSLF